MHHRLCSFAALAGLGACAAVQASGTLVGHWKFDESAGPTAFDSSPNGLHGTLAGAASFVAGGMSGNAISLARATNGFVSMGALPYNASPFSLAAWIKTTSTEADIVVGRHRSGVVQGYFLAINSGAGYGTPTKAYSYVSTFPGLVPISDTSVTDGQWHHLLMTHSSSNLVTIYVDGVLEDVRSPGYVATDAPFFVGGLFNGASVPIPSYTGLADDVQYYSGVLNGRQICQIVNNPGTAATANIDGDIDGDGDVDFADLNLLLGSFNLTGFCLQADVDGDGDVDFPDLNSLLSNYNTGD